MTTPHDHQDPQPNERFEEGSATDPDFREDAPTDPGEAPPSRVNLLAEAREGMDPFEEQRGIPVLVGMVIGATAVWGFWYLFMYADLGLDQQLGDARTAQAFADPRAEDGTLAASGNGAAEEAADGKVVYEQICASCHQGNGLGVAGAFPPLDGSEWLDREGELPAAIVVHGLQGRIEVKGQSYEGVMPGFGNQLSDAEITAVVSYVRGAWSNDAPPIDVETVRWAREARSGPVGGQADLEVLAEEAATRGGG
jgi:mono/diheme cytochrome c family protein